VISEAHSLPPIDSFAKLMLAEDFALMFHSADKPEPVIPDFDLFVSGLNRRFFFTALK